MKKSTEDSQDDMVLAHLKRGRTLTPLEALDRFNCFRLGARIHTLKGLGHDINSTLIRVGDKRVAQYSLARA